MYYKQTDRHTGQTLAYLTYNAEPVDNHPDIRLKEVTQEEFLQALEAIVNDGTSDETDTEEGAEPNGE